MEYVKGNNLIIITVGLVFLYLSYKSNNTVIIKSTSQPTSILKEKEKEKDKEKEKEVPKKKDKDEDIKKKDRDDSKKSPKREDSKKSPKKDDIPYLSRKSSND